MKLTNAQITRIDQALNWAGYQGNDPNWEPARGKVEALADDLLKVLVPEEKDAETQNYR